MHTGRWSAYLGPGRSSGHRRGSSVASDEGWKKRGEPKLME